VDSPETSSQPEPRPAAPAPAPAGPAAMRASDADRDRIADLLREALAEGRLTPAEHAERIDAVYEAKTYAELAPLVADLPAAGETAGPQERPGGVRLDKEPSLPAPRRESASIVAVFGGADRRGRWLVEPHTSVLAAFGGVDLDFRQAVLSQREVNLTITCLFGGVTLKVPPGVRVVNSISAVFGGVSGPEDDVFDADAPVIRLSGVALFGGVDIKHR
jgi:Domain of unknown function (DUF1707)/Cell wall-active antibiotics response 4TMS YvqF